MIIAGPLTTSPTSSLSSKKMGVLSIRPMPSKYTEWVLSAERFDTGRFVRVLISLKTEGPRVSKVLPIPRILVK